MPKDVPDKCSRLGRNLLREEDPQASSKIHGSLRARVEWPWLGVRDLYALPVPPPCSSCFTAWLALLEGTTAPAGVLED